MSEANVRLARDPGAIWELERFKCREAVYITAAVARSPQIYQTCPSSPILGLYLQQEVAEKPFPCCFLLEGKHRSHVSECSTGALSRGQFRCRCQTGTIHHLRVHSRWDPAEGMRSQYALFPSHQLCQVHGAKLLRLRLYNTEALGPKKQQAKSYEREPAKLVDREPRSARRKRLSSDTSCA
jgi:hypothetical protein